MTRQSKQAEYLGSLVGRWTACDEWATDLLFVISRRNGEFKIRVIDQSDGEVAEVYGLKATKEHLSFAVHYSSGRFTKYRLRPLFKDQMEVVYTYTATDTFKRGPKSRSKRSS